MAIFIGLMIIGIVISGCKTFFKQVFYICLCRPCLKCIIKMRKNEKKADGLVEKATVMDIQDLDRKILSKLNEDLRKECYENDSFQNDEERIVYAESKIQMKKIIRIIHEETQSTPWDNYMKDFKKAFGPKNKLFDKTAREKWQE